ncbi:hypothetical protein A0E43_00775 [Pectobacterium cacticida]
MNLAAYNNYYNETVILLLLRWSIAFLFIATPFNPYVGGMTLYLWLPLVFLDYEFLKTLKVINLKIVLFIMCFSALCVFLARIDIFIKFLAISIGVLYVVKLKNIIFDKIYACMLISALWCIVQFLLFHINPEYSAFIGPSSLSSLIWGSFSTPTFTNQYVIFLLPRMSGLSREAGFFVSLLLITFIIRMRDAKVSKIEIIIFILAYLFSLSKISLVLFIFLFLYLIRRFIKMIPVGVFVFLFFIIMVATANYLKVGVSSYYFDHESIAHRLSSAYLIGYMTFKDYILGCQADYRCLINEPIVSYLSNSELKPNIGLIGIVIELGIWGGLSILFFSSIFRLDSYDLSIIICFTITVTLFTLDSFVILTYYYVITNKLVKNQS